MAYVSNKLTHWAGRNLSEDEQYDVLCHKILAGKELKYGYCPWNFGSKYGRVENFSIAMISFADIPHSESGAHSEKYSKFGISFDKLYLANCHAGPVGYVQNPFVHSNYVHIHHGLNELSRVLSERGIEEWVRSYANEGKPSVTFTLAKIMDRFQYVMNFLEDYAKEEFRYHEVGDVPLPGQDGYFEDRGSLYYEREWRMVLSDGATDLPWITQRDGSTYFTFREKYVGPVIVPRKYVERIRTERETIFANWEAVHIPEVIAFEDLLYM